MYTTNSEYILEDVTYTEEELTKNTVKQIEEELKTQIEKSEGFLSEELSAQVALNRVRALGQNMGTYFFWNNKRIRVFEAEYKNTQGEAGKLALDIDGSPLLFFADGALKLLTVQSEGKKKCNARDWARGIRF